MNEIQKLKSYLDREMVIKIMQFIGYEFNKQGFTSLRDERTPSTSVDKHGYIKDFGTGWRGDIFDLLVSYKGLTTPEAVKYVKDLLNV
jgi:DNA primase